ncbi:ATP-binding cassette domain-containing protein [Micromonospora halotolerans]|uniref:ATP-binding cassette domain-containing protein n=1 Tax=Micromonospora halotolerans TaxID=709879 RepID=A0ABZ0A3E9_9ACTN|nr:ATP-binding cassette domain-containing protein [Micromonospora halotolerans]WNM42106.1 ATP-binding cassette domain-containing protein [Micromonospora halotolerans]
MSLMIEAVGLRKSFGKVVALDGLDVRLEAGQVAAILGPNGAGKTTFLRMLSTLVRPDGGTLRVCGVDATAEPARVRQLIGLAGQHATVEPALTGRENLQMIARLFGQDRRTARASAAETLERLRLGEAGDRLVRTYSGGMRRRLDLGASLVGRPRLLLLDEPTTGLDPQSRIELWDTVRALTTDGTDVLLTTQYLEEADRLADTILIIDHGQVIASGTAKELKSRAGRDIVEIHVRDREDLDRAVRALARIGAEQPVVDHGSLTASVAVDSGPDRLREALQEVGERGVHVEDVALRRPTLDEVFLSLTGSTPAAERCGGEPRPPGSAAGIEPETVSRSAR